MGTRWWVAVVGVASITAGCGGASGDRTGTESDGVRIASFDFEESQVVAELYAQVLEAEGIPVVRLGAIGPREVVAPALEQGVVDLVPEYLGTASRYFGVAAADREGLAAALAPRGLVPLTPAPAQDLNVVVVTGATAARLDLLTIGDLAPVAGDLRIGGPVECAARPMCLIGLRDVYGLEFSAFVPQRSQAVTAEALRRGEIEVGVMFSTAPELGDDTFVVLADDRHLQPAEYVVPLVRAATLERWGSRVADGLAAVSRQLTTDRLRALNAQVRDGATIESAVAEWLRTVDLGSS